MKITHIGGKAAFTAALAAAAIVLTACGSSTDPAASSTPAVATTPASSTAMSPAASTDSSSSESSPESSMSEGSSSSEPSSDSSSSAGSSSSAPTGDTTFEGAGFTCATGELRSSGSTAQGKAIAAWITAYNAKCKASIGDYGGGGSSKGISDFVAKQTDFGGSDSALKDDQKAEAKTRCAGADAIDLPMVTGPIAIAFKLEGVTDLTLTPALLAGIFDDKITNWDDEAIKAANPGATLPNTPIQTIHRSEDSGTTENFAKYLKATSDWPYDPAKAWAGAGGTGANGSDGVAAAVAGTDGAIGYVEWGFATSNNLSVAKVDNGGGAVELTAETAGKAVAAAEVTGTAPDLALKLDYATKEAGAYPIILVTYEIVCSSGNGDKTELVKSFLGYTATDGQKTLTDVGAAPLPAEIQSKVIEAVKGLK